MICDVRTQHWLCNKERGSDPNRGHSANQKREAYSSQSQDKKEEEGGVLGVAEFIGGASIGAFKRGVFV